MRKLIEKEIVLAKLIFMTEHAPQKPIPQVLLNRSSFPEKPEDFAVFWLGAKDGLGSMQTN